MKRSALVVGFASLTQVVTSDARAFTQGTGARGTGGTPMGHEWITVLSAMELVEPNKIGADDPRQAPDVTIARAKDATTTPDALALLTKRKLDSSNLGERNYISTYGMNHHNVLAAVVGERWVDIGGFNILKAMADAKIGQPNCFNAVAQLPNDLQHDHFCRERDEAGGEGAVKAAADSASRFQQYFVAAAMAPDGDVLTWDGGLTSAEATVDRHFFLMGRALHLLQDSFSGEHSVRRGADGYQRIHGIKTYLCSVGADQHSHVMAMAMNQVFDGNLYPTHGDVIWKSAARDWTPANMKPNAIAALEATKDLWAAFLRTMLVPRMRRGQFAIAQAKTLAATWMAFDAADLQERYAPGGPAQTEPGSTYVTDQAACDETIGGAPVLAKIEKDRLKCFANLHATDARNERTTPKPEDMDEHLRLPFHWNWKHLYWINP